MWGNADRCKAKMFLMKMYAEKYINIGMGIWQNAAIKPSTKEIT
jgi:hypothetical protein